MFLIRVPSLLCPIARSLITSVRHERPFQPPQFPSSKLFCCSQQPCRWFGAEPLSISSYSSTSCFFSLLHAPANGGAWVDKSIISSAYQKFFQKARV